MAATNGGGVSRNVSSIFRRCSHNRTPVLDSLISTSQTGISSRRAFLPPARARLPRPLRLSQFEYIYKFSGCSS